MNATPPADDLDALREFAAECLARAAFYASHGEDYACLRDDAGLAYAMRNVAAHVRAALDTLKDIRAAKEAAKTAREVA
jgi:type IV secretory pathway VirD2 relaxase